MLAKIFYVYTSVVLLLHVQVQYSIADDVTELPATTAADLTTAIPEVVTTTKTLTTTTPTATTSPTEIPVVTATTVVTAIDTTLKPISIKKHKRRKASKDAIKKYTQLLDFTIAEVVSVADLTLNVTKQLFKDVISNLSNYEDGHNNLVNEKIANLSAFIVKINTVQEANDTLEKLNLVEELDSLMEPLNDTTCSTTSDDQVCAVNALFHDAFKQHNLSSLEEQVEQRNLVFLENFTNAANKFWNSLSARDKRKGHMFNEWFMEFQSSDDADTKFDLLWRWFDV